MFTFESFIDLPLIWAGLIGTAVLLYVLLDGFDLGVGILFPFAPSDDCRSKMMNSIAPFWDGNETWLVLGGGGLFAAFPLAYAIVMPAMYIPIILMLLFLIFRGVAFEFRFKAGSSRALWDHAFHFGSLGAAFMQGMVLGGLVQGIAIEDRSFGGDPFDWLSAFTVTTGLGVVFGYALLGATWTILKTEKDTQSWANKCARYTLIFVAVFMAIVSLWVPYLENDLHALWFEDLFYVMLPLPIVTAVLFGLLFISLKKGSELWPFILSVLIFLMGFLGLAISLWPYAVPYQITIWDAAAANTSLSLMLVGVAIMLPIILGYVAYCYYIFRGKAGSEAQY
jgi:cytochrome d ubiquinol oxidase subunit II